MDAQNEKIRNAPTHEVEIAEEANILAESGQPADDYKPNIDEKRLQVLQELSELSEELGLDD